MIKQIRIKKRKKTTNYTYLRKNLIDRKLNKYFSEYIKKYYFSDKKYPLILFLDSIYREINEELKNEHEKTIPKRTLFKYLKRKIMRYNIYCIIFRINKRTKKLEIYYEHKPEARSILTEEQVMKLDNELSKDSTNEKNEK